MIGFSTTLTTSVLPTRLSRTSANSPVANSAFSDAFTFSSSHGSPGWSSRYERTVSGSIRCVPTTRMSLTVPPPMVGAAGPAIPPGRGTAPERADGGPPLGCAGAPPVRLADGLGPVWRYRRRPPVATGGTPPGGAVAGAPPVWPGAGFPALGFGGDMPLSNWDPGCPDVCAPPVWPGVGLPVLWLGGVMPLSIWDPGCCGAGAPPPFWSPPPGPAPG